MNTSTTKRYSLFLSLFLSVFAFSAASAQTTYYSYVSGSWNNTDTWTTDPSGTLPPDAAAIPSTGDTAVILSGRTVTLQSNVLTNIITIKSGATLDLNGYKFASATGLLFGKGTLKSSLVVGDSAYVPAYGPTTNSFFDADGGTMEFAFNSGVPVKLPNAQTRYNNLTINLSNAMGVAYFASACNIDLNHTLTINGNFHVLNGAFRIGSNATPACDNRLVIDIKKNVIVDASGKITVGKANTNTSHLTAAEFKGVKVNNTLPLKFKEDGDNGTRDATNQYFLYPSVAINQPGPFSISNASNISAGTFPTTSGSYHKIFHRVYVGGDFTNSGVVKFHNLASIVYDELSGSNGSTTGSTGAASVFFQGAADNTITCNNTTDFYNLVIDKGTSNAHQLTINSDAYTHFRLWGPNSLGGDGKFGANPIQRKALWLKNGTLRLTGNLAIPSLTEGSQDAFPYKINMAGVNGDTPTAGINSDFAISSNGKLLIDGTEVIVLSTADFAQEVNVLWGLSASMTTNYWALPGSAMSIYGTFEINSGYVSTRGSAGFVFWNISGGSGSFLLRGGNVDAAQLRSAIDGLGKAAFDMSGGQLRLRGRFSVFGIGNTPTLPITFSTIRSINNVVGTDFSGNRDIRLNVPDGLGTLNIDQDATVFNMSGGVITILDVVAPPPAKAIEINSISGNYAVTGGTINVLMTHGTNTATPNCDDRKYFIANAAPLANVIISQQGALASDISAILIPILPCCGRQGGITTRPVLPLKVLNDLTITNGAIFNASGQDVLVGGNLTVAAGSVFNTGTRNLAGIQTTTFNGSADQTISIAATGIVQVATGYPGFNSLKMDKATGTLTAGSDLNIRHTLTLTKGTLPSANGIFNDNGKLIKVSGSIYNDATHKSISAGAIQVEGGMSDVKVTTGGTYAMPTVTGNGGSGATFNLQIINGVITSISVVNKGIDYITTIGSQEPITFSLPGTGTRATGFYTIEAGGKINSATMNNGGSGYGPAVTFSVVGTPNAVLYPVLTSVTPSGASAGTGTITAVDVVESGTYASKPVLTTSSATLDAVMSNEISGDGNGQFGNLTINKPNFGATLTAAQTVNGTLKLTDGVLDLGIYQLVLTSNQPIAGGTFGTTRMIRTAGNQSDGGIKKTYSLASNTFTFPLGTGSIYTPATINVATAGSFGTIRVRPDNSRHPFATGANNALLYYWKVSSTGFVGPLSVQHTYNYVGVTAQGSEVNYVSGVYNTSAVQWFTTNNLAEVDKVAKSFSFNNLSTIDGDYTAGQRTDQINSAFGGVVAYYSRVNGDWDNQNSWSNIAVGGIAGAGTPNASNPVIIGDATHNHTIKVVANNAISGGLQLNTGSTLDLGTTTGHNFGFSPELPIGGSGTLRLASATFPNGDFGTFISALGGTVEYYTSGSNFTIPEVAPPLAGAKATSLITYRNLIVSPLAGQTITLPAFPVTPPNKLTVYGDLTIGSSSSYQGLTNISSAANGDLSVLGNLDVKNGTLQFQNNLVRNVEVQGDVFVRADATFDVSVAGTATTHLLTLYNGLLNNGIFDMKTSANNLCNVTFKGINTNAIAGTGGTTNFNILTVDKGTFQTPLLNVTSTSFSLSDALPTVVNGAVVGTSPLNLLNGTFRLSSNKTIALTNNTPYSIPSTACLSVTSGTITIGNSNANGNGDLLLAGKLEIKTGGTVNVGINPFQTYFDIDIRYSTVGFPEINISGGNLNVVGSIRKSFNSNNINAGSLVYRQNGGAVLLGNGIPTATRAKLEIDNEGSVFEMTSGTLKIIRGGALTSTNAGFGDLYLNPATAKVEGGTILLGTSGNGNYTFNIDVRVPLFNLDIVGQVYIAGGKTYGTTTVNLNNSPLVLKGNLTLKDNDVNNVTKYNTAILNTNDLDVTIAGDFTNQGIYNAGLNTTHFNGSTTGKTALLKSFTTFNHLSVEKTGANVVTNFSQSVATVRGNLLINSGNTMDVNPVTNPSKNLNVNGNIINNGVQKGSLTLQQGVNLKLTSNSKGSYNLPTITQAGGTDATFNMTIVDGRITAVQVLAKGSGYTGGVDVLVNSGVDIDTLRFTVSPPPVAPATTPPAGAIQSVQVITPGSGYGPTAILSGGSGTGAILQTVMTTTEPTGATAGKAEVSAINLISAGTNYTDPLIVNITGGSAIIPATATASLSNLPNNIDGNGNGQFGALNLKNALGVTTSANITVNDSLNFKVDGKLDIADNRLTLGTGLTSAKITGVSANRFIRTNGSLSDLGVRKRFAAATHTFTFPVGADANYTPVTYTSMVVTGSGAYINLKPVNAKHPNLSPASVDYINFYWNITSSGGTFTPTSHTYQYPQTSVVGDELLYINGRLSAGVWNTGDETKVDETTNLITFPALGTSLTGDYTASSLFNNLVIYTSNATTMNWNSTTNWTSQTGMGPIISNVGPPANGSIVIIRSGDVVNVGQNSKLTNKLTISGTLNLNDRTRHSFGTVDGTGLLRISATNAGDFVFPGGTFTDFVSTNGGTVEYYGANHGDILTRRNYNNLKLTDASQKRLTESITVSGKLEMFAGMLDNTNSKQVDVTGNWVSTGGTFTGGDGIVNVKGNFTNAGIFNAENSKLSLKGLNFINIGTFNAGTSTVSLDSLAKNLTGATTFYNLQVNGGGDNVSNSPITVNGLLSLNSGFLITSATNLLTLGSDAAVTGGAASSFVQGPMAKTGYNEFTFPIGSEPAIGIKRYSPIGISSLSGSTTFTAIYVPASAPNQANLATPLVNVSNVEYWLLTSTSATSAHATLAWNSSSQVGNSNTLQVANLTNPTNSSSVWLSVGGTAATGDPATTGTITSTDLTTFGTSAVALTFAGVSNEFNNPLPIRLLDFNGVLDQEVVFLDWKTASEENSSHFEIERSNDGERFVSIGSMQASGNTRQKQQYGFTDRQPLVGTSYYRLKMVDMDGGYDYSKSISIKNAVIRESVVLYPNPVASNEALKVQVSNTESKSYLVTILNLQGQELSRDIYTANEGVSDLTISEGLNLPLGMYIVWVKSNTGTKQFKLVIR